MIRVLSILFVSALGLLTASTVLRRFDGREIERVKTENAVLHASAARTDERIVELEGQIAADSTVYADTVATLHAALATRQPETVQKVQVRDSARATIDPDTLSAGLRNLLSIERDVAESFEAERDLERALRESAEQQITTLLERQRALQLLLLDVTAQRDSALVLVGDAIALADPGFFRSLFQDLPRKAACTAGGAIVAEVYDGKPLIGGVIGLATCLVVEAII